MNEKRQKGLSPIVSIITLIAISVLSAVAVWFWLSPLTDKPPLPQPGAGTKELSVESCDAVNDALYVTNKGSATIPENTVFGIYDGETGAYTDCYIDITPSLGVGGTANKAVMPPSCSLQEDKYYILRKTGYLDSFFPC
jgi:hypothetical protein